MNALLVVHARKEEEEEVSDSLDDIVQTVRRVELGRAGPGRVNGALWARRNS